MNTGSDQAVTAADIAVGVFTSALNLRERALSVQETWLKAFPQAFLIGGSHFDAGLRMISLGPEIGEDYQSAHRKQFLGIVELYRRFPEAKWFFVTGCDAFVFAENLASLLSRYDYREELLVGGHCGEVEVDGVRLIYPSGGPGFALSRALVEALVPLIPAFVEEWEKRQGALRAACDAALAFLALRERGVRVSFAEGFYHRPPYRYPQNGYKDGEGRDVNRPVIERPIAFHNLSIREMYLLAAGHRLKRPRLLARSFDAISTRVTRGMQSKTIMNRLSRALFARGGRE
jgi:hypothetical protein